VLWPWNILGVDARSIHLQKEPLGRGEKPNQECRAGRDDEGEIASQTYEALVGGSSPVSYAADELQPSSLNAFPVKQYPSLRSPAEASDTASLRNLQLRERKSLYGLHSPIRPTSIFLVPAGAIGAGLVEHALTDILPDGVGTEVSDGIDLLHLDDPRAARAFDPQDVSLDVGEAALLDRKLRLSSRARIGQQAHP
jgi:hypothetical protein